MTTYHSYLFHGGCTRDGRWFPNEPEVDVLTPSPSELHMILNRYSTSKVIWPGLNPIVSSSVKELLGDLPYTRFQKVVVDKVVEFEWSIGTVVSVSPGDLSRERFFERLPSISTDSTAVYYELQVLQMVSFPASLRSKASSVVEIECGTAPVVEKDTIRISTALFDEAPVFLNGMSLVCADSIFAMLEQHIDPNFYVVRKWQLE